MTDLPQSILFCCDHNAVRSPMAEGLMKFFFGTRSYVQSAGVKGDMDIDGFSIAVCQEVGIELSRHKSRSFDQMEEWGEDLSSFDLVVALSEASHSMVQDLTRGDAVTVVYWPIYDPTGQAEQRDEKLDCYRRSRNQIADMITDTFGRPTDI